jgi:glutathione transport system ATP-binding protein
VANASKVVPLLDIAGLTVRFPTDRGPVTAVRGLDVIVADGETVAVVGESGSGKSVTALAITRLIDHAGGRIEEGSIRFRDRAGTVRDLTREPSEALRNLRGPEIAMVFQEPMTSLNPVLRVGDQIAEAIKLHQRLDRRAAREEARRMLERVRIPEAGDDRDGAILSPPLAYR